MEADGHFERCPGITTPVLASFGPDVKQLAGKIELKEKFNGWFAVNFLPVEI